MNRTCRWPQKKTFLHHSKKKGFDFSGIIRKLKQLTVLAVILAAAYFIFVSDFFEVKNLKLSGNAEVKSEELEKFIFDEIRRSRIYSDLRGDMLLMGADRLEKIISNRFNIVRKVEVRKKYPNELEISISEKSITAIWCRAFCYWLDEEGVVFEPFSKNESVKAGSNDAMMVLDDENTPLKIGDKVADKNFLDFARIVRRSLKDELSLDYDNLKTPGVITDEIWVQTRQNWRIFFNVKGDAEEEVLLLKQILKEKITPDELKKLEYIDLRIKDKVFYRTKNMPSLPAISPIPKN